MTAVETELAPVSRRAPRWSTGLRLAALALIVLGWVGTAALAGRSASSARLISDLQHGRTHHVVVLGDRVVWRDGATLNRTVRLKDLSNPDLYDVSDVRTFLNRYPEVPHDAVIGVPFGAQPRIWLTLGSAIAFFLLLFGPRPLSFNRWGWFWLLYVGRAAGLGTAGFLLLSGPSRIRPPVLLGRRRSGAEGFCWSLVCQVVVVIASLGVLALWPALLDNGIDVLNPR